jgi:hypothetical protein
MGIFDKIKSAIFGTNAEAISPGSAAPRSGDGDSASAAAQAIDIAPILDSAVAAKKEKFAMANVNRRFDVSTSTPA